MIDHPFKELTYNTLCYSWRRFMFIFVKSDRILWHGFHFGILHNVVKDVVVNVKVLSYFFFLDFHVQDNVEFHNGIVVWIHYIEMCTLIYLG